MEKILNFQAGNFKNRTLKKSSDAKGCITTYSRFSVTIAESNPMQASMRGGAGLKA
jgi:hypothetical protein